MNKLKLYTHTILGFIIILGILSLSYYKVDFMDVLISVLWSTVSIGLFNYAYLKSEDKISKELNKYYNKPWLLTIIILLLTTNTFYGLYSKKFFEVHFGGGGIIDLSQSSQLSYIVMLLFQINIILLLLLRIKKVHHLGSLISSGN